MLFPICKSTLLNLLGGLDSVTSGQIIVNNQNVETFNDNQLTAYRARNVGFIFQFYNLIPNLTSLENVEFRNLVFLLAVGSNFFASREDDDI